MITQVVLPCLNCGITLKNITDKKTNETVKDFFSCMLSVLSFITSMIYFVIWLNVNYADKTNKNIHTNESKALPYLLLATLVLNATKRYIEKLHGDAVLEERIKDLEKQSMKNKL